jgi:hypothetical protein
MSNEQQYIISVIKEHELGLTWIAQRLGRSWDKQRVHRVLWENKDLTISEFKAFMRVFEKHNFKLPEDYNQSVLNQVAEISKESAELVSSTIAALSDFQLSPAEIADALLDCKKIEQRLNKLIDILTNLKSKGRCNE